MDGEFKFKGESITSQESPILIDLPAVPISGVRP
jgi:hypothetical protein